MNIKHLKVIADQYKLKLTAETTQQISSGPGGGHLCWKIKSEKNTFFIKQLDPTLDINDKKIIDRYELCESIAFRLSKQDIPAVPAIRNNDKAVTVIENIAYLLYPWIEGYTLKHEISEKHAVKIAEVMVNIHVVNLNIPELAPKFDIHTNEKIISSLDKVIIHEKAFSSLLKENKNMILSINDRYLAAIDILKEKTVITHGDIFSHNVIWQESERPFLIDWEAVKNMNPTFETIRASLAWGGAGAEPFSFSVCEKMLKTYINFGGPLEKNHVKDALNGMYGNIINWLLYNIDLLNSDNANRKNTAINEINKSIATAHKLIKLHPVLFNSIMQIF